MKGRKIEKVRNSNLELLRIISMLLIVMHHYSTHGFSQDSLSYSFNKYIIDLLYLGGKLGVNCFILISGYFMINSNFTLKKLLKLLGEVWFYSIGIFILFITILTPVNPINFSDIKKTFLPVTYSLYWFITIYVILMILSPYINKFINTIDKITYQKLIAFLVIIWSVIPTLISGYIKTFNDLGWFITLYLIAGYIRKYANFPKINVKKHFIVANVFIFMLILSSICFNFFGYKLGVSGLLSKSRYFAKNYSIILVIIAVELFIGFVASKERKSKFINVVSSATLGVYLIHDNLFIRPYLWKKIFKSELMYSSKYLIIHAIFTIITVYIICTIIDLIRQITIERLYLLFIDKYLENGLNKITKICTIIKSYIRKSLYKFYY